MLLRVIQGCKIIFQYNSYCLSSFKRFKGFKVMSLKSNLEHLKKRFSPLSYSSPGKFLLNAFLAGTASFIIRSVNSSVPC